MTQLYTVTINKKAIITTYHDKRGKNFTTREEIVPQVYHDLPMATALGYRELDENAVITAQEIVVSGRQAPVIGNYNVRGTSTAAQSRTTFKRAEPKEVEATFTKRDEGYAGVVNAMVKDAA